MREHYVSIETAEGPMPSYQAEPDGDARGAVVVVHEAFGVTPHIEDVTQRLASAGYRAVAPGFFHRQGSPVLAYDNLEQVMPLLGSLTADGLRTDMTAALDHLGMAAERSAVVGFCMGGTITFFAATLRPIAAAVTFYGGGVTEGRFGLPALVDLAPALKTPWLGLFGDQDHSIPVPQVEELRRAASSAGVPTDIVRYADAEHGFHCNDRPAVFNQTAASDAWKRTLDWFDRHMAH